MQLKDAFFPLQIMDDIIVRSPAYSFHPTPHFDWIYELIDNESFLEAIYIASPALYDECIKAKAGLQSGDKEKEKLIKSLQRYYSRMCSRSTPFGLFSACGTATWGNNTRHDQPGKLIRHTRLDMHYLQQLVSTLSLKEGVREHLLYYRNNSCYISGKEIRFIEYRYVNSLRSYKISAVTVNSYISMMLENSRQGITREQGVNLVAGQQIPREDATRFVGNLIDSQLLVSEFEACITGEEDFAAQILHRLAAICQRSGSPACYDLWVRFGTILDEVKALDGGQINSVNVYRDIIRKLQQIQPVEDERKTFHIDSYRIYAPQPEVRDSARQEILDVVEYFMRTGEGMVLLNRNLEDFKAKFRDRYDTKTVPLVEALDTDMGIGYPVMRKMSSARLVDDIPLNHLPADTQIRLNVVEKWLFEIIRHPQNATAYSIDLARQGKSPLYNDTKPVNRSNLPLTMSVTFRLLNDKSNTLYVEGFYGPSASAVLARFTYGHPGIKSIAAKITTAENELVENAVLAELVHMPEDRITNLIMHPPLRDYEIPYLAAPGVDEDHIISIEDLYLRLEHDKLVLFSKKLNKIVLPRKGNMHNHTINSLPIYNFLGDLQEQGAERMLNFFSGELLKLFVFLPRFYYKNTIVSPATWSFPPSIMEQLAGERPEAGYPILRQLRHLYHIPDRVLYVEGDNELLVDFCQPLSVQAWFQLIKNKASAVLREFLYADNDPGLFCNQYIASILHAEKKRFGSPVHQASGETALQERNFSPGSEWLYLKLYCGTGSVDLILRETMAVIMQTLSREGMIRKWFFIKYYDTDFHIRLRMELNGTEMLSPVLRGINDRIAGSREKQLIWRVQPDIYIREMERYGASTMEICESIFHVDSVISLDLLSLLRQDPQGKTTFLWAVKMVDDLLGAFQMSINQKIAFCDMARKAFQGEFNAGKAATESVNAKYGTLKSELGAIMSNQQPGELSRRLYFLLNEKIRLESPLIDQVIRIRDEGGLMTDFHILVSSLIHMQLNRLITHKERLHEFLLFELLYRHYNMVVFKARKNVPA